MTSQNIKPEIAIKVSPDRMYVIRATLCVVVFNQERGSLNPVIVRTSPLRLARPGEVNVAVTRRFDLC